MKPIYLSLAGLQSYREKQEVDFTRLCDAGVFGIFGPTGSGKSSILDAITLALYGKVERAAGGTQGILNHAEKTLAVAFTFELAHPSGKERYRVERQFKRTGDDTVAATVCRLIREDAGGAVVLADKATEVNRLIQELLGLTMQDFTRAVVLPQGKFAEFLSLKGKDRRQMLQRLFRLERFGDQLNAKLSDRFRRTEVELKQTEAEQYGLGDASEEALKAAEARLADAAREALRRRTERDAAERLYEEGKRVRELMRERDELLGGLKQAEAEESIVKRLEEELERAGHAARIRPYLEEREAAEARLTQARHTFAEAENAHARAAALHDQAASTHAAARDALAQQDGPLQLKLERLNRAAALQDALNRAEQSLDALRTEKRSLEGRSKSLQEQAEKVRRVLFRAEERQRELNDRLKKTVVAPEERERLQAAFRAKQQLDLARQHADRLERELAQQTEALANQQAAAERLRDGVRQQKERQLAALRDALDLESRIRGLERLAVGFGTALAEWAERAKRERAERETRMLARKLSEALVDGMPCPVCGSLHHPAPAESDGSGRSENTEDAALEKGDWAQLDELRLLAKEQLMELVQLRRRLRAAVLQSAEAIGETDAPPLAEWLRFVRETAVGAEDGLAEDGLAEGESDGRSEDLPGELTLQTAQAFVAQTAARLAALEEAVAKRERGIADIAAVRIRAERQLAEESARLEAAQSAHGALADKLREARETAEALRSDWPAEFRMPPEAVEAEMERIAELDRLSAELRARLEKSVEFIAEQTAQANALQEQAAGLEKRLVQIDADLANGERHAASLREEMFALAGRGDIAVQIADVSRLREELVSAEQNSRLQAEQTRTELQRATERLAAARQALELAEQADADTREKWRAALAASPFADAAEARKALLAEQEAAERQERIRRHRERQSLLRTKLEETMRRLDGRELTDAQWEELARKTAAARSADEEAVKERTRAERDLEELRRKHEQWKALERRRTELAKQLDRLGQLQSVLRGNAFVEFIAEEQLMSISRSASQRLADLTRQRYALEVDSAGGFVICDNANGGIRRPVSTLSGGETFLTSLALALALSSQIQLNGQYPLEFFFLDEGFGTLDPELLETVVGALERLHADRLTVGVISHVPELKARLPRRLIVEAAEPGGRGSVVRLETM